MVQPRDERISINVEAHVWLEGFDAPEKGLVRNIGPGGMFIALEQGLPSVGGQVKFKLSFFRITPENSKELEGLAIVRWLRPEAKGNMPRGVGLEFVWLADDSALKDLVSTNQRP